MGLSSAAAILLAEGLSDAARRQVLLRQVSAPGVASSRAGASSDHAGFPASGVIASNASCALS